MNKEIVEKSPVPEENPVEEAIKKYYQLKGEYMKKYENSKKKITSQNISKQEMRNKLKNMKVKCLNCKQFGGMIFSEKNRILSAKCGNNASPCQLDLQIKLPKFMSFQKAVEITNEDIDTIKKTIIDLKLDLLFGLKTEEDIEEDFETNKEEYKQRLIQLKISQYTGLGVSRFLLSLLSQPCFFMRLYKRATIFKTSSKIIVDKPEDI